jgi:thiamine-monophosphate kinase
MSQPDALTGEFAFIEWLRKRTASDPRVPIGIGDDTAAIRFTPGREVLVTTDMILDGIHFDSTRTPARLIGRKAMAVNLSDIAAMAGVPVAAVVSVGMPDGFTRPAAEDLYSGMRELADEFHVAIVGGDTNRSISGVVICVALLGEATPRGPVRRNGARPGDWIMATGTFGGSILGKHLNFTPRVREALLLHEKYDVHAMIDVSDGLAADLGHILNESRCGAVLRAASVPVAMIVGQMAGDDSQLTSAFYDGEDFELVLTLPPDDGRRLLAERPLDVTVSHIGEITTGAGLMLEWDDGLRRSLEPRGYDHFKR